MEKKVFSRREELTDGILHVHYKMPRHLKKSAKLSEQDARDIVDEYANTSITQAGLAKRYGVCQNTIFVIIQASRGIRRKRYSERTLTKEEARERFLRHMANKRKIITNLIPKYGEDRISQEGIK